MAGSRQDVSGTADRRRTKVRFRRQRPAKVRMLAYILLASLLQVPGLEATELRRTTQDAFDRYARLTEVRFQKENKGEGSFLWVDSQPEPRRTQLIQQLKRGEALLEPMKTLDEGNEIEVPHGMIHHWMGTAFLPGVSMMQVAKVTLDYNNHFKTYAPDVGKSKLISKNGDEYKMYLRFIKHKIITVVEDTDHEVHFARLDEKRSYCWSHTTRVQEVDDAGKSSEKLLPVGNDGGFMWRLYTYWRFVERDGGTYLQVETITLTRDIPWGLRWLIGPYVKSVPRESMVFTVEKTKAAALAGQHTSTTAP